MVQNASSSGRTTSSSICFLFLFVGFLLCGLSYNSAADEDNLTLYVSQNKFDYPKNAKEHLLIIAHRKGKEPFPILLYTSDGSDYTPVPVNDQRQTESDAKANRKIRDRQVEQFVELVLGKKLEDLKGEAVADFQEVKLGFTDREVNGEWGDTTWVEFIKKIKSNKSEFNIIELDENVSFVKDPSRSLATYNLEGMREFASMVLDKFDYYKKRKYELDKQISKLILWRKILITVIVALIGSFITGIIIKIFYSKKQRKKKDKEVEVPRSQQRGWPSEAESPPTSQELQNLRPVIEEIRDIKERGLLSQIKEAKPRPDTAPRNINKMADWLSTAKKLYEMMQDYKAKIQAAAESSSKQSAAITDRLNSIEEEISSKLDPVETQIDNRLTDLIEEKEVDIAQLMAHFENDLYDFHNEADKHAKDIKQKAETTTQLSEQIQEFEENLRKENVAVWGQWIQDMNRFLFTQAVEQLQEQHRKEIQEKIEGKVTPEKKQSLQTAKKLLEDFCGRMKQAERQIPPSISNVVERVNLLLQRLGEFPRFELYPDSLQEYNAQQAEKIIEATMSNTSLQQPNYAHYIWQAYSQAFNEYAQQLQEEIDRYPEPLTDDELESQFRDLASMTLNAFYPYTQADTERQKIVTYFDKKVLPPLLDAFGFEEIPITIGKTKAMETLHDITESRQSEHPSGTVIELLYKGFRKKDDPSAVVQKARVIRAE